MAKVYVHPPVGSEIAVGWEAVNKSWEEVLHKVTSKINMSSPARFAGPTPSSAASPAAAQKQRRAYGLTKCGGTLAPSGLLYAREQSAFRLALRRATMVPWHMGDQ
jgi:hypothetical protein